MSRSKSDPLACSKCHGRGETVRKLVECYKVDSGQFCDDHIQHYQYGPRCWLCFGSGRADIFTMIWRTVRKDTGK